MMILISAELSVYVASKFESGHVQNKFSFAIFRIHVFGRIFQIVLAMSKDIVVSRLAV